MQELGKWSSARHRHQVLVGRDRGQTAEWQFQRDLWGGVLACPRVSANPDAWSMIGSYPGDKDAVTARRVRVMYNFF